MNTFINRSPYFYTFINLIIFTLIVVVLSKIDLNLTVISVGLGGAAGLLTGTFFMTMDMKCERLMFRFLALQSTCIGFYLWVIGMELADVREWILGFVWIILILLPAVLLLVRWLVQRNK